MKKMITFAAAFGLMASMATAAFADEDRPAAETEAAAAPVTGTSTTIVEPTKLFDEPLIQQGSLAKENNEPIVISAITPFCESPNGKIMNFLSPQVVFSTGSHASDVNGDGEWIEIYTWLGKAWVHVPAVV
ncbi:hypothetical protein RJP21_26100 [Paenibacillus sp. VCA1]|uniref:hypothetical protein n=1 Tax=Paenibacillus sp. VCA1 TaxID=3039148 RepID=UPI0028724F70|nr:hypothetical protein [Paenibacillus sp. VCA1]MDR9857073.1 hypothetical protein [Paenibacillus sp. VCA1]